MMYVLVPPLVEPITVEEAFNELSLDTGANVKTSPDYAEALSVMKAARAHCENLAGRAFVQQTIRCTPDRPVAGWAPADLRAIKLPRRPLLSLLSVSYYGTDNVLTAVPPISYYAPMVDSPAVHFASDYRFPALHERPDAVQIDYIAGYPPGPAPADYDPEDPPHHLAANVPEEFKRAIRLTMRLIYQGIDPALHRRTQETCEWLINNSPERVWSL